MSSELCEMSLQQTKELLRLTDLTLQNICCRRFTGEQLYMEALQLILGGKGRRGPAYIFLGFQGGREASCLGHLFHLAPGRLVERSPEITIDPAAHYAIDFANAEVVVSNWADSDEVVAEYQGHFPPQLRDFMGQPIQNFVAYRISGNNPGFAIAFNYPGRATDYDADVIRSLTVVIGSLVTLSDEVRETEKAFQYTIEALARACEAAEEETGRHILRVNRYAGALAANLGYSADFVEVISYSAQMHDVGKIRVPREILLKPGRLDPSEEKLMRLHPIYGQQILGESPRLHVAREIAIAHHENWDGSGYPHALLGEAIPLGGRIVKVADVYDALRSRRSYKPPLSHDEALQVFRTGDERIVPERHFDPAILAVFFQIEHIFAAIYVGLGPDSD